MGDQVAAPGRQTEVDPRVEARLSAVGGVVRWLAVVYALIGVVGLALPAARDIPPDPVGVRDLNVAGGLALAALAFGALLAGDTTYTVGANLTWRRVGVGLSIAAGGFGLLVMSVFFIDQTGMWGARSDVPAFSLGLILTVLGAAIPLSVSRSEWAVIAGQIGALLVFSLAAVIGLGYVYGDPSVGRLFPRPAISFQAALSGVLIAIGAFLVRPGSGLLSVAVSAGPGGKALRRLGPLALLTPALLLFIVESVPITDRLDAVALVSVGLGLVLLILLAIFVRALDTTAIEAATMAAQAERATIGLEQEAPVVNRVSNMLHIVTVDNDDGWEVATRYRPGHGSVAGDASIVRTISPGLLGAVLVDITGHGAEPAILALRVRDLLIQALMVGLTPAQALNSVSWSAPGDVFASAIVVTLSRNDGDGWICSAGHPPAILVGTENATLMEATGPLLYLDPAAVYTDAQFTLAPGHELVLFSDGVGDVQKLEDGRTEPEKLSDLLLAEGGTASRTAELVLGFADRDPSDDQSVVVIQRST